MLPIDVLLCLWIFGLLTTFDARSVLKLELPRADGQPAQAQGAAAVDPDQTHRAFTRGIAKYCVPMWSL